MLRIEDSALVPIFLESRKRRLLLAFAGQALSVSQAAASSGESLGRIYHHVRDLLDKGLLRVEREEQRHGRPIKYYRAVAERFFVPIELLPRSPSAGLAAELRGLLDEERFRSNDDGVHFYTEKGAPRASWSGPSRTGATAGELWRVVALRPAAVSAFAAEMKQLMEKYDAPAEGGRPYLLHAAWAPRARGPRR